MFVSSNNPTQNSSPKKGSKPAAVKPAPKSSPKPTKGGSGSVLAALNRSCKGK